jgi:hypothetical protein
MGMRLASAFVLVLGVAVLAGPAAAGNGNGNGSGDGKGTAGSVTAVAASPGNSATAPGQLKKDDGTSSQAAPPVVAADSASSSSASDPGVKPASGTAHDTHAAASSTKTKLYGNGQTAGEIAIRNGAPASTVLHGPGNSQPHKAALCSGGHEVDVHAFKSNRHRQGCGSVSTPPGSVSDGKDKRSDPGQGSGTSAKPTAQNGDPSGSEGSPKQPKPKRSSNRAGRESSGVLATAQVVGRATLPFTGFPLWVGVVLGVLLLVLGLTLSTLAGRESEREVGP